MLPRVPETLGRYRILERIDEGGMGIVYRAVDTHLGRDVAIKILPAKSLDDETARRRLLHEAQLLSRLQNPHVAQIHDYGRQGDVDFMVLEYVCGSTLAQRLVSGPLPEASILDIGLQLADGLAAAHAAGLVHCDVKPENVRITPTGEVKLLDFGLARHLPPPDGGASTLSASIQGPFGTPPYMAPEMLQDAHVDPRIDIYSFGVVLYQMATGRRPLEGETPGRLVNAILHDMPVPPRQLNPRLSVALENVILKALDKSPERRYQTARELGVDLSRIRTPSAGAVRPRAPRRGRRTGIGRAAARPPERRCPPGP